MKFVATTYLIKFDKKAYLAHLKEEMEENAREAAAKWLKVVLMIIPTWSRASRATFEELAAFAGIDVSYGPVLSDKDRFQLGRSTGRGGPDFQKKNSYYFYYETDLRYLKWNEFNKATKGDGSNWFSTHRQGPGPYRFIDAGKAEFESFAQEVKLPNPMKFIEGKKI